MLDLGITSIVRNMDGFKLFLKDILLDLSSLLWTFIVSFVLRPTEWELGLKLAEKTQSMEDSIKLHQEYSMQMVFKVDYFLFRSLEMGFIARKQR